MHDEGSTSIHGADVGVMISTATFAQSASSSNYASFDATPEKPLELGYYASAHKGTCSPAPLPEIRIVEAPKSGQLTVRRGELTTNKIPGCPGLKTPVQVVFYQARADSTGSDHIVYTVKSENGEVSTYDVTINIKAAPKPRAAPLGLQKL